MKETARIFKALADETRLRILALLTRGELCVCDLMSILDLPQSTVSRHLAYLRNAGLVNDRRQGVWMYYALATTQNTLHADLQRLLRQRLIEHPQAREDLAGLDNYVKCKSSSACP
ncbi:ArsR/SmtB family transcription factor [Geoalkalibacter halelectricus]|uniref:Metalloregulator ArsR/SmtB family transcription factor n=1 Tax=Geoalkalibacter halelectricus TaxID=2847045 RepID=A0ABY5ZRQ7_9BACT|nr:metalloregulator ArsR/SmtB family transcription factor [Geoalkalibacter halelectricus]MDO3379854.1 metalloregulator ArsR/SmtB family transcription factor [Geoalkalibacter halelectricus]UWZ80617.1 metalloregulator ArsR/SmtB family transcription factor [Geoalkalibacter halelectricus]